MRGLNRNLCSRNQEIQDQGVNRVGVWCKRYPWAADDRFSWCLHMAFPGYMFMQGERALVLFKVY